MNTKIRTKARTIKREIGVERAGKVAAYIGKQASKRSRSKIILDVQKRYELTLEQAAACWYAWQTYQL